MCEKLKYDICCVANVLTNVVRNIYCRVVKIFISLNIYICVPTCVPIIFIFLILNYNLRRISSKHIFIPRIIHVKSQYSKITRIVDVFFNHAPKNNIVTLTSPTCCASIQNIFIGDDLRQEKNYPYTTFLHYSRKIRKTYFKIRN